MNVSERVQVYLFKVKGLRKVFVRVKKVRDNLAVFFTTDRISFKRDTDIDKISVLRYYSLQSWSFSNAKGR